MPKLMRVGDTFSGTCNSHGTITGTITGGSPNVKAENKAVARIGDKGTCSCGHVFTIKTGSSLVKADGIGICRVGDNATVDVVGGNLTAQNNPTVVVIS